MSESAIGLDIVPVWKRFNDGLIKLVDYVHVISKGRVVYSSDPQTLWADEKVKASYLGI